MAKYGKWIGAGLGFVMGGPIGPCSVISSVPHSTRQQL